MAATASAHGATVLGIHLEEWQIAVGLAAVGMGLGLAVRVAVNKAAAQAPPEDGDMGRLSEALRAEYKRRYAAAQVRPERLAQIDDYIDRIVANRARYEQVGGGAGVPWYVVGVIHLLEASLRFNGHLHNGDSLAARTVHVPANRPAEPPASGSFPYTWEESAEDTLARFASWRDWTVGGTLYQLERFNGWGYQNRRVPSPYLWSFSDQYTKGKYASDGVYDPELVSRQAGAGTVLRRMEERGIISIPA